MNPYERLRESLRGTPLDGVAERVKAAYNLRDDDPTWTYVATVEIASAALVRKLEEAQAKVAGSLSNIDEALRAAAIPIVEGLAAEIRMQTVEAVREDATAAIIQVLSRALDSHAEIVGEIASKQHAAGKTLASGAAEAVDDARTGISELRAEARQSHVDIRRSVTRVAGWSPLRIVTAAVGMLVVAGSFTFGFSARVADDVLQCSSRVQHLAVVSHWSTRLGNVVRHDVCGW